MSIGMLRARCPDSTNRASNKCWICAVTRKRLRETSIELAAHLRRHLRTSPQLPGRFHHVRIDQCHQSRPRPIVLQQFAQDGSAIAGCSRSRGIGAIAEHNQAFLVFMRLRERPPPPTPIPANNRAAAATLLRRSRARPGGKFAVSLGDDNDGRSQLRDVEPRLHGRQTRTEDARLAFQRLQSFAESMTDARRILRIGALGRHDQRHFLKRRDGPHTIDKNASQHGRAALSGLEHVNVRGRVIQHQRIGSAHHALGDVGMQIERRHQRHAKDR